MANELVLLTLKGTTHLSCFTFNVNRITSASVDRQETCYFTLSISVDLSRTSVDCRVVCSHVELQPMLNATGGAAVSNLPGVRLTEQYSRVGTAYSVQSTLIYFLMYP